MDLGFLKGKRIVVLGIGNRLKGDDGVGSVIAEKINKTISNPNVLLLDCEKAPENFLGKILDFKPEIVLILDCIELGLEPGNYRLINLSESTGGSATTHKISINVFASSLRGELNCKTFLLGIQPANTEFDSGLSNEIDKAKERLFALLVQALA